MAWTYSTDLTADKDKVRLEIGDTLSTDGQLQDEEIVYVLTRDGSVTSAAISCCRMLASRYARYVDKEVGDLKKMYSQRVEHYTTLADKLEARSVRLSGRPYAGGMSVAEKEVDAANTDLPQVSITRGIHDNV